MEKENQSENENEMILEEEELDYISGAGDKKWPPVRMKIKTKR